jgi:hypothetical protein
LFSEESMDCLIAIAPRNDKNRQTPAISRRNAPELCRVRSTLQTEGVRECRVPSAPAASCAYGGVKNAHEYSQRSHRKSPGIPARNGFTAYTYSPRRSGFLASVACGVFSTSLTPASRRQDHTTSPSASRAPSSETPLASTASRSNVRDDRETPLRSGRDGAIYAGDLGLKKTEIFL